MEERSHDLYFQYGTIVKPLMAEIEAKGERMPLPIFNEIRAFNDHIARCHYLNLDSASQSKEYDKAERHIVRMTLDCFKCLNLLLFDKVSLFERQTRNTDLTVLDNGNFYPSYRKLKAEAARLVKEAKRLEGVDMDESLSLYQQAYNTYSQLEEVIDSHTEDVRWAKVRFTSRRILTAILWILSVIISSVLSICLSSENVANTIRGFF